MRDKSFFPIERLPSDVITHIFSFFGANELVKAGEVSKTFNQLTSLPSLWRRFTTLLPEPERKEIHPKEHLLSELQKHIGVDIRRESLKIEVVGKGISFSHYFLRLGSINVEKVCGQGWLLKANKKQVLLDTTSYPYMKIGREAKSTAIFLIAAKDDKDANNFIKTINHLNPYAIITFLEYPKMAEHLRKKYLTFKTGYSTKDEFISDLITKVTEMQVKLKKEFLEEQGFLGDRAKSIAAKI